MIVSLLAASTLSACAVGGARLAAPLAASAAASHRPPARAAASKPQRLFSASSFWNEELPADAPLDPSSAAVVKALSEEVAAEAKAGEAPFVNTTSWSVPIYKVGPEQPTVTVALEEPSRSPALASAWSAVPLPANAKPAAGGDEHLVVWQPSSDRLWEFWHLTHTISGWRAAWGGAIRNVSTNAGAYGAKAWPGASPSWGATACSLSVAGGLITLEDLEAGRIEHALAIALPDVRGGVYATPAQRSDGWIEEPRWLPEGAHLRLDPALKLSSLHLPPFTLMLAKAAQRYGIVVRDEAAETTFYAQDPTPTGTNPYGGAHGYFEGESPQQLLASFPWSHLELLKMKLHKTAAGGE
ncbi:MAG TPA: hypothetical protein VL979_13650 [Solirubrobacteraceae bacterium]|nr:hypothetical protein [Solirubrobacteraceae bacterium]